MEKTTSSQLAIKARRNRDILLMAPAVTILLLGGGLTYVLIKHYVKGVVAVDTSRQQNADSAVINSEDPTTDWETYVNTKYVYSIQYPHTYRFRQFPGTQTGAGFSPLTLPDDPFSESITIDILSKGLDSAMINLPIEKYATIAATREIQNYEQLASIKKIITKSGIVGYETTWMVRPLSGGDLFESLPITYFQLPYDPTATVQVSLRKKEDLALYERMLGTLKFLEKK